MAEKKSIVHPNFFIGIFSYLLLLIGVVLNSNQFEAGSTLIIMSVLVGCIHWVNSVIDVWADSELMNEEGKRYFWFALVIMIPPLGGMMYYMILRKRISI